MNVFSIGLEARDPPRNRWRFYSMQAGQDLFGAWVVRLNYGRIGTRGRVRDVVVADEAAGRKIVKACLRRRDTAVSRIGVSYQVREVFDPHQWAAQQDGGMSA